jgi:hypothetical protein
MTPYEAIFERPQFEDALFPDLTSDAEAHGLDTRDLDSFLQLPAASALLDAISPGAAAPGAAGERSPIAGVAALAYHGYHFWRHGKHTTPLDDAAARAVLDPAAPPIGPWPLAAPRPAGYVQFPPHLLWAKTEQSTPEPVHGFFYATSPAPRIDFLIALSVRPERAAVTAIEIAVQLPVPAPGHFGDLAARDEGEDFANVLPGGELRGLHAVTNAGEVLKLASRVLYRLVRDAG